jgi:uncharacterized phage-associated protein
MPNDSRTKTPNNPVDPAGPHNPLHVANNILKRAFDQNVEITPMKLQRLLYFVAADYGTLTHGTALFFESFRAWEYGPVLNSVYEKFRSFNGVPIRRYSRDAAGNGLLINEETHPSLKLALDRIWGASKHLNSVDLSELARLPGSPWGTAWQVGSGSAIADADVASDRTYRDLWGSAAVQPN